MDVWWKFFHEGAIVVNPIVKILKYFSRCVFCFENYTKISSRSLPSLNIYISNFLWDAMAFLSILSIPHENILTTSYVFCCGCLLNTFQKKSEGIKTVIHSFVYILLYLRTPAVIFCLLFRNKNLAAKLTGKRRWIFFILCIQVSTVQIYAELKKNLKWK